MAKKNLKRGLALGALMAFVITGSAMADELDSGNTVVASGSYTVNNDVTIDGAAKTMIGYVNSSNTVTIDVAEGKTLTVISNGGGGNCNGVIAHTSITGNGNIVLHAKGGYPASGLGQESVDSIVANSIDITSDKGYGLYSTRKGESHKLNARSISIKSYQHAVFASASSVELKDFDKLSLTGVYEASGVYSGGNALVSIEGNSIDINSDKRSALAVDGGKITIAAKEVTADTKDLIVGEEARKNAVLAAQNSGVLSIDVADKLSITNNNVSESSAIKAEYKGKIDIKGTAEINTTGNVMVVGEDASVSIDGSSLDINVSDGAARGIYVRNGSKAVIGSENTKSINIVAKGNSSEEVVSIGMFARENGSTLDVTAKKINVDVSAVGKGWAYGVDAANYTTTATGDLATLNMKADDITITSSSEAAGQSVGLVGMSQGVMNIDGNLVVTADSALTARGGAKVNVNADGAHTTVFNGDIDFDYDESTSGTKVDADVNINFAGADSAFNGKINITGNPPVGKNTVSGMKVQFSNGATWNLTGASKANDVTFGAGSNLKINGVDFVEANNVYALNGNGNDSLKVEQGANLIIEGMEKNTYNIAKGFGTNEGKNFTIVNDNALMQAEMVLNDAKELKAVVTAKSAEDIVSSGAATNSTASMLSEVANNIANGDVAPESKPAADFIQDAMSGQASGNTPDAAGASINSALQIGEAGGNSATALSVVNNVTGITTQRLSFSQMSTAPQGGHGKVERKYKSGAGIWAQYMHGKDKVEDMPMDGMKASYDSQYNGAVIGYDFAEVGKVKYGIAFNYGEGDSHSKNSSISTRSDYDFWGVGLYTSIMNDDSNIIFDINYSKSDSDVTQINGATKLEASPETTSLSAGVKFEKLIQKDTVQVVPYAGLRFLTVDTDDYAANIAGKKAFMYAPDRQNIWLIPVGVSLRQENSYENGWKVTPKADLSYIWAVGDTDSSMTVSIPGITNVSNMNYTVMDNGSFLGTLGIEAEKGDWTYGLSYSYQKGEYQRSDKWFVDVRYSF